MNRGVFLKNRLLYRLYNEKHGYSWICANPVAPRDSNPFKVSPRNITPARPRLLQIAANG